VQAQTGNGVVELEWIEGGKSLAAHEEWLS
jgi:hypothetical protein